MKLDWLTIHGETDAVIATLLAERSEARLKQENFTARDVEYVATLFRPVVPKDRILRPDLSVRLRELCKTSEVSSAHPVVTSHRKFLGPIIVRGKRMMMPIVQQLLKQYLERQKKFNLQVVTAYAELASDPYVVAREERRS